jgi:hypothetical protein
MHTYLIRKQYIFLGVERFFQWDRRTIILIILTKRGIGGKTDVMPGGRLDSSTEKYVTKEDPTPSTIAYRPLIP